MISFQLYEILQKACGSSVPPLWTPRCPGISGWNPPVYRIKTVESLLVHYGHFRHYDNWRDVILIHVYMVAIILFIQASLVAQTVKHLPAVQETRVQSLVWEDPLEREMATHSRILTWRISWTEEPGGLQFVGSQRVRHNWMTNTHTHTHTHTHSVYRGLPWWLSGKAFACQSRRLGFNPWVGKIPWRRKWQPVLVFLPANPRDRGAWQATFQEVAKELDTTEWLNSNVLFIF